MTVRMPTGPNEPVPTLPPLDVYLKITPRSDEAPGVEVVPAPAVPARSAFVRDWAVIAAVVVAAGGYLNSTIRIPASAPALVVPVSSPYVDHGRAFVPAM